MCLSGGPRIMSVRVRFAPSPTGYLHIGGARTALSNWLFARERKGTFILRIEDTDFQRSSEAMVDGILDGLRWLGLNWDEGPYFQSQRMELYRSTAKRLLDSGHAYRCFCSQQPEEKVDEEEEANQPKVWKQDEVCRHLPEGEIEKRLRAGEPYALRLRVPREESIEFQDVVYGTVQVQGENVEDFVLLRSDATPTYHLSVVADDIDMGITHVIRGVDHLLNTIKHLLLYRALERTPPVHGHLPLILGADKKRLSKRHGATSVLEYRKMGFLPSAMRNHLALLGWSPGTDQELFSDEELIRAFDLRRINKANAVFDIQKLEWMNGHYMASTPAEQLLPEVQAALKEEGLWDPQLTADRARLLATIDLLKSRCKRTVDFADYGRPFFTDQFEYQPEGIAKYLQPTDQTKAEALKSALSDLISDYSKLSPFDIATTEAVLRRLSEKYRIKPGELIGAVRIGLTGRTAAPPIFDVIVNLGRDKTVSRLARVLESIR